MTTAAVRPLELLPAGADRGYVPARDSMAVLATPIEPAQRPTNDPVARAALDAAGVPAPHAWCDLPDALVRAAVAAARDGSWAVPAVVPPVVSALVAPLHALAAPDRPWAVARAAQDLSDALIAHLLETPATDWASLGSDRALTLLTALETAAGTAPITSSLRAAMAPWVGLNEQVLAEHTPEMRPFLAAVARRLALQAPSNPLRAGPATPLESWWHLVLLAPPAESIEWLRLLLGHDARCPPVPDPAAHTLLRRRLSTWGAAVALARSPAATVTGVLDVLAADDARTAWAPRPAAAPLRSAPQGRPWDALDWGITTTDAVVADHRRSPRAPNEQTHFVARLRPLARWTMAAWEAARPNAPHAAGPWSCPSLEAVPLEVWKACLNGASGPEAAAFLAHDVRWRTAAENSPAHPMDLSREGVIHQLRTGDWMSTEAAASAPIQAAQCAAIATPALDGERVDLMWRIAAAVEPQMGPTHPRGPYKSERALSVLLEAATPEERRAVATPDDAERDRVMLMLVHHAAHALGGSVVSDPYARARAALHAALAVHPLWERALLEGVAADTETAPPGSTTPVRKM